MDLGSAVSRASGITDAELAALVDPQQSPLFSRCEKLVLDLAAAMSTTPADVPDELREALLEYLTPAQLTEVAATVAWENYRARLNRSVGAREAGFSDGAYCVVPHRP